MNKSRVRRRLSCHHEAGHAFVRWYFGHMTDRIIVLTPEQVFRGEAIIDDHGRSIVCEGLCIGTDILGYPFGPIQVVGKPRQEAQTNELRAMLRDIALIDCFAGANAEALYSKISVAACILSGGFRDMEHAKALLDAWNLHGDEKDDIERLANQRASALVRSPRGALAIKAIADALRERGEIEGEEVETVFRGFYDGRQCRFGAWSAHWPPTLHQLRTGFIPDRE